MNRVITDEIKGIAILSVLCNHYINDYTSLELAGFANGIISVFFILSGYGIYSSLDKSNRAGSVNYLRFFLKRAFRIYPLYLISILIFLYINKVAFEFINVGLILKLASPLSKAPSLYWFVTYLLQCYLIAPLIFILINKYGIVRTSVISLVLLMGFYTLSYGGAVPFKWMFTYRLIPLGHIVLFIGGMIIKELPKATNFKLNSIISLVVVSVSIFYTRSSVILMPSESMGFIDSTRVFSVLLIISSVYLCYTLINVPEKKVLSIKFIKFIGVYSYSIYLFHLLYFKLLAKLGIIKEDSVISIFMVVLLLPVFFYVMKLLEKSLSRLTLRV